jgi:hypothetical protein
VPVPVSVLESVSSHPKQQSITKTKPRKTNRNQNPSPDHQVPLHHPRGQQHKKHGIQPLNKTINQKMRKILLRDNDLKCMLNKFMRIRRNNTRIMMRNMNMNMNARRSRKSRVRNLVR